MLNYVIRFLKPFLLHVFLAFFNHLCSINDFLSCLICCFFALITQMKMQVLVKVLFCLAFLGKKTALNFSEGSGPCLVLDYAHFRQTKLEIATRSNFDRRYVDLGFTSPPNATATTACAGVDRSVVGSCEVSVIDRPLIWCRAKSDLSTLPLTCPPLCTHHPPPAPQLRSKARRGTRLEPPQPSRSPRVLWRQKFQARD